MRKLKNFLYFSILTLILPGGVALAADDEQVLEEVVVTGSHIPRKDLISVSPVRVISTEAIDLSGVNSVATLLNELPAAGVPGSVDTGTNFRTTTTGLNTIDLRNLGVARALVLVNGRRHVGGSAGSPTVDVSMIPTQLVDRVEIVTGGASAVYGSEAISGVINFITKDDFEGVEFYSRAGRAQLGGAKERDFSILAGGNFDEGRGNATVYAGYSDRGILYSRDRDLSANDATNSSFGPKSSFFVGASSLRPELMRDDPSDPVEYMSGFITQDDDTSAWDKEFVSAEDGFNRNQVRLIRVPSKRVQFNANLTYEVNPNFNFFSETSFKNLTSESQLEPTIVGQFISVGPGIQNINLPYDNPFIPDNIKTLVDAADAHALAEHAAAAAAFAADSTLDDPGDAPEATTELTMRRRFVALGPRTGDIQRRVFRTVLGVKGEISDNFDYEFYYQYGNFSQDQTNGGVFNSLNFYQALRVEENDDGDLQCVNEIARSLGCVPLNVFGRGSIEGEALDWVSVDSQNTSRMRQQVASFTVFGTAFSLPAGDLGVAFGAEWREEKSTFNSDSLAQSGLTSGNSTPNTVGVYDVNEYFVEAVIPILADIPGINYLGLELAARSADYSTIGSAESYKASVDWRIAEGLRFRGGYSNAVRAPNIDELFDPGSETFRSFVDPCAFGGMGGMSADGETEYEEQSATVQAHCATFAGTATLDPAGVSLITSAGGLSAGNPDLEEESSDTVSYGFVYSPPQVAGLNFTVDYFDIEITDAIAVFTAQTTVDQCARQGGAFCTLIERDPMNGLVNRIDALAINVAEYQADGVDFSADYTFSVGTGEMYVSLNGTRSLSNDFVPFAGGDTVDSQGETGVPDWKANVSLVYDLAGLRIGWSTRYISGVEIENDRPAFGDVDSFLYHDLHISYTLAEQYEFFIGADNVLDEEPPMYGQGTPGDVTGTNTAADVYDPIRRYWYAGVKLSF